MKHIPLNTNATEKKKYLARYPFARKVGGRPSIKTKVPSDRPKKLESVPPSTPPRTPSESEGTTLLGETVPCAKSSAKRSSCSIPKGLTARIHPTNLQQQIALEVLRCLARFRIIRAVDIAVYCFAERPYTAARQAARRALRGLLKQGCVLSYKTERYQTIYAMTEAGKRLLADYGYEGTASIRRAANMVNPNHTLWLNFITLTCESRGLSASTESEILRAMNPGVKHINNMKRRGLIEVIIESENTGADGRSKVTRRKVKLLPDAVAYEEDGITWFEIDASRRGPERVARLMLLIRKIDSPLGDLAEAYALAPEESRLKRISMHATNPAYFHLLRNRLMREVRETERSILTESANNFRVVLVPNMGEGEHDKDGGKAPHQVMVSYTFEVWRARDCASGQEDICVGHVILQLLPTGLPNYKGNDEERSKPAGWFEQNYLPYRRPASLGTWSAPKSQFPLNLKRG